MFSHICAGHIAAIAFAPIAVVDFKFAAIDMAARNPLGADP